MLHHPRRFCELAGGHGGPASRVTGSSHSPCRVAESAGRGRNRVADSTAGIYEPVPGLLDTLFVPKEARYRGLDIEKSWPSCWGSCIRARPGPILDLRLGAGRTGDPVASFEYMCMCVQYPHGLPPPRAPETIAQQTCGSWASSGLLQHLVKRRTRALGDPLAVQVWSGPQRNDKFPSVRCSCSAVYRDGL